MNTKNHEGENKGNHEAKNERNTKTNKNDHTCARSSKHKEIQDTNPTKDDTLGNRFFFMRRS